MSILELTPRAEERPTDVPVTPPLTFWKLALAVFVGNLLTGVVAALAYEAVTH